MCWTISIPGSKKESRGKKGLQCTVLIGNVTKVGERERERERERDLQPCR